MDAVTVYIPSSPPIYIYCMTGVVWVEQCYWYISWETHQSVISTADTVTYSENRFVHFLNIWRPDGSVCLVGALNREIRCSQFGLYSLHYCKKKSILQDISTCIEPPDPLCFQWDNLPQLESFLKPTISWNEAVRVPTSYRLIQPNSSVKKKTAKTK